MSDEQAARYGRYDGDPAPVQLTQYFLLTDADLALLEDRRRKHNKLGMAVQLCSLRFLGTFPPPAEQVPARVVDHVAQQLGLSPDVLHKYGQREATRSKHRALLLTHLGYQEFGVWVAIRLIRWLYAQLSLSDQRPSLLFDLATAHLVGQKIVLPGVTVLAPG
ncbi:DUF4158 domain-containing protein [Deinococcus arcticus]|uniref:DUF4158 domain-containing protein n=1 Tax=Deinococcus arcticus TaxID=2136176 RepID=UPI001E50AC8E|nr:DUF4158 domain-containing protein [Deinococcus arcticus]